MNPTVIDITFIEKVGDIKSYQMSIPELFEHYNNVKFIHEKKKILLEPNFDLIINNWEKAISIGKEILWTVIYKSPKLNHMASVSIWRSTSKGWLAQHLTSTGITSGLVSVLLHAIYEGTLKRKDSRSCQNWYCHENLTARKIYDTMVNTVGEEYSSSNRFEYIKVYPNIFFKNKNSSNIKIFQCTNENNYNIYDFCSKIRGKIYANAEEFNNNDIELINLDEIYKKAGLRRRRYIWIAYYKGINRPVGAAICYRGPLGLNFSFLENRCDLLMDEKRLSQSRCEEVSKQLLYNASKAYFYSDLEICFPLNFIPVITSCSISRILKRSGAIHIRDYHQCIWLKEGFFMYYNHIINIFKGTVLRMKLKNQLANN